MSSFFFNAIVFSAIELGIFTRPRDPSSRTRVLAIKPTQPCIHFRPKQIRTDVAGNAFVNARLVCSNRKVLGFILRKE